MAIYLSLFAAWSIVFISFGTTIWPQRPYRVQEHNFVRYSQSVYFARTQIACFLRWLLLQVGMCGQVLILSFCKLKKIGMRWLKIGLVTPLKWPYWGGQKGSLRVRHVRRLSMIYGRMYLSGLLAELSFTSFYSGRCVYQAQSAHSILSDVFMNSLFWHCKAYWWTSRLDIQENASSFLWSSQSTTSWPLSVCFY